MTGGTPIGIEVGFRPSPPEGQEMPQDSRSRFPHELTWRLDEISSSDPNRASALEKAGSAKALVHAIKNVLDRALVCHDVRWGREQAASRPDDCRAVVQFHVGTWLFDWFFNAKTGYRAHFRVQCESGLRFNNQIIRALRRLLDARLPEIVLGWHLNDRFEDCGQVQIPKTFLMNSLTPDLSKVWFCTKLIGRDCGIKDLPLGVVGPRILLNYNESWAAPSREDDKAWLEIKGAFLGEAGPYQPKDPRSRARTLRAKGEA